MNEQTTSSLKFTDIVSWFWILYSRIGAVITFALLLTHSKLLSNGVLQSTFGELQWSIGILISTTTFEVYAIYSIIGIIGAIIVLIATLIFNIFNSKKDSFCMKNFLRPIINLLFALVVWWVFGRMTL